MAYTDRQLAHLAMYLLDRLGSLRVSQGDLARHYEVDPKSIRRLISRKGTAQPSRPLLAAIAKADGVTVPMLLGDEPLVSTKPSVSATLAFFSLALLSDRLMRADARTDKERALLRVALGQTSAEWRGDDKKMTAVDVVTFGSDPSTFRYRETVGETEVRLSRIEAVDGKPTLVRESRRMLGDSDE